MRLSPFSHQVPCGLAGLSTFAPPGTLEPGDWRDSVLSAPQVPHGLVGLSPFGHQVTLGREAMEGHACQDIYFVYWYVYIQGSPSGYV